ncbi:MAG: cysteine hydrolase [Oscillospiraceae bacterium]|nr:cysteine hydrolase [Oscillospiraceae bacterium]
MAISNLDKIKKEQCVLVIIDMQNDFIAEGAPIECKGGRAIIPNIQKMKAWARGKGIPVIYTQEVHRPEKIDFGLELVRNEPEHCVEGQPGTEIVSALTPEPGDFVVVKRRYSAFYLTDFEVLLKGLGRNTLLLAGAATNVCVYATALDAQQRDMPVVVLSDCCAGITEELHQAFLQNVDWVIGDVSTSDGLMEVLG